MVDKKIRIATGKSRNAKIWRNEEVTWGAFVEKLKDPYKTGETMGEYENMTKTQKATAKDVGGFFGGYLKNGKRRAPNVTKKSMLTLDADFADACFCDNMEMLFDWACCIYSTHSHTPEKPRYRLIIPLQREVTPDEYQAIARKVASQIGIDMFDDSTYQANRLMYWPSIPDDGEYIYRVIEGQWLDPDEVLKTYEDWRDVTAWPVSSRVGKIMERQLKKQGDPLEKNGVIGGFCRAYTVPEAIETFLEEVYEPCGMDNRYTYKNGSSAAGLVIYEDKFAYSNHATDPVSGILCNAFDLVWHHKFDDLDEDVNENTPVGKYPSYQAMMKFAAEDKKVRKLLRQEKIDSAKEDFSSALEDPDQPEAENDDWLSELDTDNKGNIANSVKNIKTIMEKDPRICQRIAYDEFSQRVVILEDLPWRKIKKGEFWGDVDDAGIRNYLEAFYGITAPKKIEDAWILAANENSIHQVRDYLKALVWDGQRRIDTLFIDYLGAEDNVYTREATRKTLVAAVARVYQPGVKFDTMTVLIGPQGTNKSTIIRKLGRLWYSDSLTTVVGKEAFEQLRGFWILEMGELTALKKAEVESIKHFTSKVEDSYRNAYGRHVSRYPRQCIFIGTTNRWDFLTDRTGNRRFWPLDIHPENVTKDVWKDMTGEEIDQIWAEAVAVYQKGETLRLQDEVLAMAEAKQLQHMEDNPLSGLIEDYLERLLPENWADYDITQRRQFINGTEFGDPVEGSVERTRVCAVEIWVELLGHERGDFPMREAREIKSILAALPEWEPGKTRMRFGKLYGSQAGFVRRIEKNKLNTPESL